MPPGQQQAQVAAPPPTPQTGVPPWARCIALEHPATPPVHKRCLWRHGPPVQGGSGASPSPCPSPATLARRPGGRAGARRAIQPTPGQGLAQTRADVGCGGGGRFLRFLRAPHPAYLLAAGTLDACGSGRGWGLLGRLKHGSARCPGCGVNTRPSPVGCSMDCTVAAEDRVCGRAWP